MRSAHEATRQEKKIRQNWKKKISRIWVPGHRRQKKRILKKNRNRIVQKKILPPWVPGQRRYALTRLRVPDLDGHVAAACYFCAVWAVNHRPDPAFRWDESACETTRQGKKIRQNRKKKISRIWVPGRRQKKNLKKIGKLDEKKRKKISPIWVPGRRHALTQLRQGKKIRWKKKSHEAECPVRVDKKKF